jgi:FkbM family methyltransferase
MSDFSFSEHGEDILIHRLLLWKESGFYLDCGAYHSRNMSMTARLRLFGWLGVNIDIDPNVIDELNSNIPSTISVCAALSSEEGVKKTFYQYSDPVLNTIDDNQHNHLQRIEKAGELFTNHINSIDISTKTVRSLLAEIECNKAIDYLNLDVEGVELDVLKGFPWESQKPSVVSIEIHRLTLNNSSIHPVVS